MRTSHAKELILLGGGGLTSDLDLADFSIVGKNGILLFFSPSLSLFFFSFSFLFNDCFVAASYQKPRLPRQLLFSEFLSMIMQSIGIFLIIILFLLFFLFSLLHCFFTFANILLQLQNETAFVLILNVYTMFFDFLFLI